MVHVPVQIEMVLGYISEYDRIVADTEIPEIVDSMAGSFENEIFNA